MKRILIILIFFIAQKNSFSSDWITFVPAKTQDFSESFKNKMVKDLYPKLYKMLDDSISKADFDFALTIGETNLKMTERDGLVFISAYLNTEYATQYPVTICWTSLSFKNKLDIHKSDITNKNVVFSWCNDFPKAEILEKLRPWKVVSKDVSGYKFDMEYHTFTFPDIAICFNFDSAPSEQTLNTLEFEFKKYDDSNKSFFYTN